MSPETTSLTHTVKPAAAPTGFGSVRLTPDDRLTSTQERARVAGYAAGFAAGSQAAAESTRVLHDRLRHEAAQREAQRSAEHAAALAALQRASQAAAHRVVPVLDEARELLHARAFELARAILGHELGDGDTSARAALARALDVPHDLRIQTVRLHPSDIAALAGAGSDVGVELVADPALAPGDAVSTFEGGFFDARIEAAFERALVALQDADLLRADLLTDGFDPVGAAQRLTGGAA